MNKFALIISVGSCLSYAQAVDSRDNPLPDFGPGYLTFYLDNDLFANKDQDYTNGARLSWISGSRKLGDIGPIQRALRPFTGDDHSLRSFRDITNFNDPKLVQYNYGFSLTQLMFTPEDNESLTQPVGQRRYAGWAALGFSLHAKDAQTLNSVEFLVGVTGKNSFAQETQDYIHDVKNIDKFQGWDNQIPSEVTFDWSFVQKRRLDLGEMNGAFSMDGVGEWGARLGTFRTGAHVGGMLRLGFNLPPDFSDPRLTETAYAHKYFIDDEVRFSKWSLFLLGGCRLTAVGYDATLDGPMFHEFETGNTRKPIYGEMYAGVGFRLRSVEITYAQTWRSKEYQEQTSDANFGTLSMRMEF